MKEYVLLTYSTRRRYTEVLELPDEATYDHGWSIGILGVLPLVKTRQFIELK